MTKQRVILLILTFFTAILCQNCAPNTQNDQILSGTYNFQFAQSFTRYQCYNVSLNSSGAVQSQEIEVELAYGITNILKYQNGASGLDFSVRAHLQNQNSLLVLNLLLNNGTWQQVSVQYLLTFNRPEFLFGSYIADTSSLLGCSGNRQTIQMIIPVVGSLPNQNSTIGITLFLNGLRTNANSFDLQWYQPILDFTLQQINFTLQSDASPQVELLFITYLILDLGQIQNTFSYSISNGGDYTIGGIAIFSRYGSLQYSTLSLNKTNRLACVGLKCNGCVSVDSCQSQGGTVTSSFQCIKCSLGQIILNEICVSICGQNQVYYNNTGCVCIVGTYLFGGSCISCPTNAALSNGKCQCNQNYYNISGICQSCPPGTSYSTNLLNCAISCTNNLQWINGACGCASPLSLIGEYCGYCPSGTQYASATQSCQVYCGGNQVLINGVCVCQNGYFLINNVCSVCPTGTIYNQNNQNCAPLTSLLCGTNQILVNGQCLCNQGYTLSKGTCVVNSTCGNNKVFFNGICQCTSTMFAYQGNCYPCPANSTVNSNQSGCVCNPGFILTSVYTCIINSLTTSASTNVSLNSQTNTNVNLLSSSNPSATKNANAKINPNTQVNLNKNSKNNSNSNNNGQTSATSTSTIDCPQNSYWSNNQCICSQGFTLNNNQCTKCGSALYYDGSNCLQCPSYCLTCQSISICTSCPPYFKLAQTTKNNQLQINCSQVCGDGRKFVLPCDDGNNLNGDGCSSTCRIESGWTCSGGSPTSKDTCVDNLPSPTSIIQILQDVLFDRSFFQNIKISYLPSFISQNNCSVCNNLIVVSLVSNSSYVSQPIVTYTEGTTYQWIIDITFPQNTNLSPFKFKVQINKAYSVFFSSADMAQAPIVSIDPSSLQAYNFILTPGVTNSLTSESVISNDPSSQSGLEEAKAYFEKLQLN